MCKTYGQKTANPDDTEASNEWNTLCPQTKSFGIKKYHFSAHLKLDAIQSKCQQASFMDFDKVI